MEYILWNTHKKVKADLKSSGRTKKRLKIWPIDRKDLKRQFSLVQISAKNLLEPCVPADHLALLLPPELPPQEEEVHPGVAQHAALEIGRGEVKKVKD